MFFSRKTIPVKRNLNYNANILIRFLVRKRQDVYELARFFDLFQKIIITKILSRPPKFFLVAKILHFLARCFKSRSTDLTNIQLPSAMQDNNFKSREKTNTSA